MEIFGYTVFCDDIREEVNGKHTLVGCYSGGLKFHQEPPATRSKLCAWTTLLLPKEYTFQKAKIFAKRAAGGKEEVIFNQEIFATEIPKEILENSEDDLISVSIFIIWTPFKMEASGYIKVRAVFDEGDEVKLGALKISFSENSATVTTFAPP